MSGVPGAADIERKYEYWIEFGARQERERVINLLIDLNAIRRDALGELVAFDTYGEKVIYLTGLENK